MPLYAYHCPDGHEHVELFKHDARPDEVPCDRCPETARYVLSAPARGVVVGTQTPCSGGPRDRRSRDTGPGLRVVDWTCEDGHADFDVIDSNADVTLPPCATCGKPTRRVWNVPAVDWFTASYPNGGYFPELGIERDPSTGQTRGMFVASAADMRRICKERGLVIMSSSEAERGIEQDAREASVAARRDEERFYHYQEKDRHGPDRAAHAHADAILAEQVAAENAAAAEAERKAREEAAERAARAAADKVLHSHA